MKRGQAYYERPNSTVGAYFEAHKPVSPHGASAQKRAIIREMTVVLPMSNPLVSDSDRLTLNTHHAVLPHFVGPRVGTQPVAYARENLLRP